MVQLSPVSTGVVKATSAAIEIEARPRITVVIPAFNEERTLGETLALVANLVPEIVADVIVVSDGSTDRTAAIAAEAGVQVIVHANNRGYGAALKSAIHAATGEFVLTMDADGQHHIDDVLALCNAVSVGGAAECVIGNRIRLVHSPLWRMPGKWLLKSLAQFLVGRKIPDLNSGLRIIRRDVALRYVRICPQGFSFSTTITMALMSRGYDVRFMPIEVSPRVGKSTVTVHTGFQTILLVIRLATLFNPLRVFLPASTLSLLLGVGWGIPYLLHGQGVTVASLLAIFTGILLFALGLICDQVAQLRLERYE
jgi:glycosyltransferase involved in cell wall biosynthesis